ncbi:MAG: hypothetical protein ACRCVX_14270 [Shewanella sp.]
MDIGLSDFYRILRDAVKYYPATSPVQKCKQLQSFRVLAHDPATNSDLFTPTLGAAPTDKIYPFFWSRKWELNGSPFGELSFDWPLLTAFETICTESDGEMIYRIELAVLDVYQPDKCDNYASASCDSRPINQIYMDTKALLLGALDYVYGTVLATTTIDPVEKIYNHDFLVQNYPNDHDIKMWYGINWSNQNRQNRYACVEYPTNKIYGTKAQIDIRIPQCEEVIFNMQVSNPQSIGFEAGCKNC